MARRANTKLLLLTALLFASLFLPPPAYPETTNSLFGFYFSSVPDLRGARVDTTTGLLTAIGTVPANGFLVGATAFDPVHRVEYIGRNESNLLVFNVDTGVTTAVALSQPVAMYFVDEARGVLYGLAFNGSAAEIRSINVDTGLVTSLAPVTAASSGWVPGTGTFDPFRGLLYYFDGTNLIEFNIATHNSRAIGISPHPDLLVFDRVRRQLIAFVAANPGGQVLKINPAVGSATVIATLPASSDVDQTRAFDPISRRFFIMQPSNKLVSTNVDTGEVTSIVLIASMTILEFDAGAVNLAAVPLNPAFLLALAFGLAIAGTWSLRLSRY